MLKKYKKLNIIIRVASGYERVVGIKSIIRAL